MRTLKILSISLIVTIMAVYATMNSWYAKNIRVTFSSESTKDLTYQVFYTGSEDEKFNEKQSVKKLTPAGINQVEMILPTEKIVHFRFDFGINPGSVLISNLNLVGDKTIDILADDKNKYIFSHFVEEHQFLDGNTLRIVSNQNDPYMYYNKELDITSGTVINWCNLLQIAFGTFFIAFLLGLFVTRKKAEKMEEKSPKNSKDKK